MGFVSVVASLMQYETLSFPSGGDSREDKTNDFSDDIGSIVRWRVTVVVCNPFLMEDPGEHGFPANGGLHRVSGHLMVQALMHLGGDCWFE